MGGAREAFSLSGPPHGEDGGIFYQVGRNAARFHGGKIVELPPVTRITVTCDLPGLHCHMERVRVFVGEDLIYEAPLHNLEGVEYMPEGVA